MTSPFPWYDSIWLASYISAKSFIQNNYPQKMADFIDAFEVLRTRPDFQTTPVHRMFNQEILGEIKQIIAEQDLADMEKQEALSFGRFVIHNQAYFNDLQKQICPIVSDLVEEELEPSYNFLSLYNNFGICPVHMDAPSAKWTLDICIDQSSLWPIYFSDVETWPESFSNDDLQWETNLKNDKNKSFSKFSLSPGEGLIFSGSSQWHYRERIAMQSNNNFCHLIFFHFIPLGTADLVDPEQWARLFDIPELSNIVTLEKGDNIYDMASIWSQNKDNSQGCSE